MSCPKCKGSKGAPQAGMEYEHCIICLAEGIEQERLRTAKGYRFFVVLDYLISALSLFSVFYLFYCWYHRWVATFFLDCLILVALVNIRGPISRRIDAEDSLEAKDKR